MTRSILLPSAGTDFSSATLESLGVRIYRHGLKIDTPAGVAVYSLDGGASGGISGLPDADGHRYAMSVVIAGGGLAFHWPEESYRPWRLLALRETGHTLVSLNARLWKDEVLTSGMLTVAEGVPGAGDYVFSGWTDSPGRYSLEYSVGPADIADNWTVAEPVTSPSAAVTAWGQSCAETYRQAGVSRALTFTAPDGAAINTVNCCVKPRASTRLLDSGARIEDRYLRIYIPIITANTPPPERSQIDFGGHSYTTGPAAASDGGYYLVEAT